MKKIALNLLAKRGLSLVNSIELEDLRARSHNSPEMLRELVFFVRNEKVLNLPEAIPDVILDNLSKLIGTTPFEGLSILNALYETQSIEGCVCEMGVAQGATTRMIASFLVSNEVNKNIAIFDSFEGLSIPTPEDELKDDIFNYGDMKAYSGSMAFAKELVLKKLAQVSFPRDRTVLYEGFIDEVLKSQQERLPKSVSLAYIDFDLYAPILSGLRMLEHRLSPGGIIIVDDYDFFSTGAKKAVDEFINETSENFEITVPPKDLGHFAVIKKKGEFQSA